MPEARPTTRSTTTEAPPTSMKRPTEPERSAAARGGSWFGWSVSKREMVSILQLAFLSDRLKIRDMPEADELTEELQNFRYKAPSNVTIDMEAWRETPGDDLVFAMMMPVWFGEKKLGTILHLPPMPRAPIETRQPTLDELIELQPKPDPDGMERL